MQRSIAYILGTSYCGSSLLNLLLDAQPGIRGLGEVVHLAGGPTIAHCALCQAPVAQCPVFGMVDRASFFASLFSFYGDCNILVDASKSVGSCILAHPHEPQFEQRVLLLSKAPHEFAHSFRGHHAASDIESSFRAYLGFYTGQLTGLRRMPWYHDSKCLRLTYRQLTSRTAAALRRVLEFLGHDSPVSECLWQTDTHVVGGNWMVAAQLQGRQELFAPATQYLDGKYAGRYRTVFCDAAWQRDKKFLADCLNVYRHHERPLRSVLDSIGQPDYDQQVEELQKSLRQ